MIRRMLLTARSPQRLRATGFSPPTSGLTHSGRFSSPMRRSFVPFSTSSSSSFPDFGLQGKVVVVTAASDGLGKASAEAFAKAGAKVAICSRDLGRITRAASDIRSKVPNADVRGYRADVTKQTDIDDLQKQVLSELGRIDVLVANVGGPPLGNFLDLKAEDWESANNLTIMSLVRLCYAVVPHMKQRGSGAIVSIQSFVVREPAPNMILSNSLRMACVGITKHLANELGPHGIRVNSIGPGFTMTQRVTDLLETNAKKSDSTPDAVASRISSSIPLRRINSPQNFGENVLWLASDLGGYITGHCLMVDGGAVHSAL